MERSFMAHSAISSRIDFEEGSSLRYPTFPAEVFGASFTDPVFFPILTDLPSSKRTSISSCSFSVYLSVNIVLISMIFR